MKEFINLETVKELNVVLSDLRRELFPENTGISFDADLNKVSMKDFGPRYYDLPAVIVDLVARFPADKSVKIKYFVLLFFALRFEQKISTFVIPDTFSDLYNRYFKSLCLRTMEFDPVISRGDTFEKDISICLGKSVLAGARILCDDGFSRSLLMKFGVKQFFEISKLLLKSKFRNYGFEMHTHLGYLDEFNAAGWRNTLIRCKDLLENNIGHDFIFVCSWIYDPKLFIISPNLKYHVDDGVKFGAIHARWGSVAPDCGALSKSKKRKQLFDKGQYSPEAYCLIWHRDNLLASRQSTLVK